MARRVKLADMPVADPEAAPDNGFEPERVDPWRNRVVGYGDINPDQLLANPNNVRIHSQKQQGVMGDVLNEIGIVGPLAIVNQKTGFLVDGHMRVQLALSAGATSIPVAYVDLDEDEELAALHTYDPVAALAGYDRSMLQDSVPLVRQRAVPGSALDDFLVNLADKNRPKAEPFRREAEPNDDDPPRGRSPEDDAPVDDEPPYPPVQGVEETVVLVLERGLHDEFMAKVSSLMSRFGHRTVTEVIVAAVDAAYDDMAPDEIRE